MSRLVLALTSDALSTAVPGAGECLGPLLADGPYAPPGSTVAASIDGYGLRSDVTLTFKGPATYTITIAVGHSHWARLGDYQVPGSPWPLTLGDLTFAAATWISRGKVTITPSYDTGSGLAHTAGGGDAVVGADGDVTITISETGLISAAGQTWQIPPERWYPYDLTAISWSGYRPGAVEDHTLTNVQSYGTDPTIRLSSSTAYKALAKGVTRSMSGTWVDGVESSTATAAPANDVTAEKSSYSYTDTFIDMHNEYGSGGCVDSNNAISSDPLYGETADSIVLPNDLGVYLWTSSKSLLQRIGDNVTVLPTGAELLVRTKRSGSNQILTCHRRAGYDQDFAETATVGSATSAHLTRPVGASSGQRYVVRQAPTASQVSEDHGRTFAQVGVGEADPLVLALRTETTLLAFRLDPGDGLMCGARLTSGDLVAVDQDGDTDTVAVAVGALLEAVIFRNGNGTWELVAIDGGDLTSYTSDGVGVQGWTAGTPQTLDSPAADVQYLAGWRTRSGLDVIGGYSAAAGGYRVWYREGADQLWSDAVAVATSAPGAAPYLYERPTGQLELGTYLNGTWYAWTANHPAGTWSAV